MLQDKVANYEIKGRVFEFPRVCDVHRGETDVLHFYFFAGFLDHSLGEIHGLNMIANLCIKHSILTGSAANLKDGVEMQRPKQVSGYFFIEITRQVLIAVVGF